MAEASELSPPPEAPGSPPEVLGDQLYLLNADLVRGRS